MKKGLLFLLLAGVLLADESAIFKEKQQEKIKDININISEIKKSDINASSLNQKKIDAENLSESIELNKSSVNIDDVSELLKSKKFKDNLSNTRNAILNDKDMVYKDMDINLSKVKENSITLDKKQNTTQNTNTILDEPIIIFISSSMDKALIKNYFKAFKKVNSEVTFVINGLLPNTGTKIMPTVNYIRDLLGDEYIFNVDIDPRKFKEYNIDRVPAVAYKKYVYIGAVSPIFALEEIIAKNPQENKSLQKILDTL